MRVLHALHHSLPYLSGYAIRSSYIVRFQQEHGIEPLAVTSAQDYNGLEPTTIHGVMHLRTPPIPKLPAGARETALMAAMYRSVDAAIRLFHPQVVHAYSPVLVGLPSMLAAKRHHLPFVYEVRDLWENASVDRGKFAPDSTMYKVARGAESPVYRHADAVVTICEALRDVLSSRVGSRTRLHVVGNGVDVDEFTPEPADERVREKWGLAGKRVIGYIGTFQPYEGLATAISAMPQVIERIPDAHLMITGAGGVEDQLKQQVKREHLQDVVTFTGRVPHDEVKVMYTIPEMFVYPRTLTRTTAITTPLKPLEAMAAGKPVLVSDVGAMLELVKPGETGMVFRSGDPKDLADKAVHILESKERTKAMSQAARAYVEQERQWKVQVGKYKDIYAEIVR